MKYEVVFTEYVKTKRRVYAYVEADSEEEVEDQINEGNYDVEDCNGCYDTDWELCNIEEIRPCDEDMAG